MKKRHLLAAMLLLGAAVTMAGTKSSFNNPVKAGVIKPQQVEYVQPGLVITITAASMGSNGTINVRYTLADPTGLPLDSTGVNTPGVISLAYVAGYIPKGQEQYAAYTTETATGPVLGTVTRPFFELGGGTLTQLAPGQYQYTFAATAPAGWDPTVTTTIAVDGNRNLTPFNLGTSYAGTTFNFVPNGSPVTVTRDVIRTESCNGCHGQLAFHGGYASGMQMCVICHQPQNVDPSTGNTLDLKVFAHKLHMGSSLPSVVGTSTTPGVPYEIIGYMNSVNNFSTVVDPAEAQRCEVCHSQTTGAVQAALYKTEPTRVACGSCHDDVNFATGQNHPGGFQEDDTECADCHIVKGETPFDASIEGAHVVPTDTAASYPQNPDTLLPVVNLAITSVTNTSAGQTPTVNFTVQDGNGNTIALSQLGFLQFTMAGPTTDYGYTSFGSGTSSTPGYASESALSAPCSNSGACVYTFTHAIPAAATGTYTIGGEARMTVTVLPDTNATQTVEAAAQNPVVNFSVDGSPVAPRRTVVALSNCNSCHVSLALHGNLRNQIQMCVLCHNPSNTDASERAVATVAADKALPPQGINFNLLVHRIHDGVNVVPAGGQPYIVVGYMGSHNDFSGVLFPGMSPAGDAPYLQNCSQCHVNSSEQNLPVGLNPVTDPQGWINPVQPVSSACSGCHVSKDEASHFLANTDSLGEACNTCHAAGAAFAVDAEHVQ
jgi:OmcA/MtrC family decaheme c-type cytochrome